MVVVALAAVGLLTSLIMLAVEPKPIPGLDLSQRQDAESAVYLAAFVVILPLALAGAPRLADRIAAGPNAAALSSLVAILVSTLAAVILLLRLTDVFEWGGGMGPLLALLGAWSLAGAAALARAAQARPWRSLLSVVRLAPFLWAAAAAMVVGTLFTVTHLDSLSPLPLAVGVVLIPPAVLLAQRARTPRRLRWGVLVDVVVVALLALAIPDLVIFRPEDPAASLPEAYINGVIQFHQDLLLGPANQVLGGAPILVDTASQYGVGSILFLVGWFKLAPIGYGTLGFLDGVLTALYFVAGYVMLRLAGASRLLGASALAIAVISLVLSRTYPVGALPQEGPLRFGLPIAFIVASLVGARWPRRSRGAKVVALAVLAISSLWAFEAFALTAVTFAAMACFEAYLLPADARARWLVRQAGLAAAACVCAHLLFAVAMLVGTGQLPEWGQYLAYLEAFLLQDLGDVTYDFSRWSPALAVGALYLASASALVLMARRRPEVVRGERIALYAVTGITAYGIAFYHYFVDRSGDHVLAYVSLPALLTGALWLSVLLRSKAVPGAVRAGALAFTLSVVVLLGSVAWSAVEPRLAHSALVQLLPGGDSGRAAVKRLWHFPPADTRSLEGMRLVDTYMPNERRIPVLVRPSLATETLVSSGRANGLQIANPVADSWVKDAREPFVRDAVSELKQGDRLLLDKGLLAALAEVRTDPTSKLLKQVPVGAATAPLQVFALRRIDERFRLRTIRTDSEGFVVVELVPRH
jgi:hypothetical protein